MRAPVCVAAWMAHNENVAAFWGRKEAPMAKRTHWSDVETADGKRLEALLEKITEVCSIPATAQKVLELTRDEFADLPAVVEALSEDPALAMEVLRIANSPFFAQRKKITSIQRAVLIIGMQELNTMAAAMAMLAAFPSDEELSKHLHEASLVSATIARLIAADLKGQDLPTVFLCGLLCEIGAMACVSVDGAHYAELWRSAGGDFAARAELERKRYGATSEEIAFRLLVRNRISEEVAHAVLPSGLTPPDSLDLPARITQVSKRLTPALYEAQKSEEAATKVFKELVPSLCEGFLGGSLAPRKLEIIAVEAAASQEIEIPGNFGQLDNYDLDVEVEDTGGEPESFSPSEPAPEPLTISDPGDVKMGDLQEQEPGFFGKLKGLFKRKG